MRWWQAVMVMACVLALGVLGGLGAGGDEEDS